MRYRAVNNHIYSSNQLAERGVAGQVSAQYYGIDKKSDQPLNATIVRIKRRSKRDICLSRVTMQEDVEGRAETSKGTCSCGSKERIGPRQQLARNRKKTASPSRTRDDRPRKIKWQIKVGCLCKFV